MKTHSLVAMVVALLWVTSAVQAQDMSDEGGPGPGGGVPGEGRVERESTVVILKYFRRNKPESLKSALERVKGVQSVTLPDSTKTAIVNFMGSPEEVGALEKAAQAAGVPALVRNRAKVVVTLKARSGADVKGAAAALGAAAGVQSVKQLPSGVELRADLASLRFEDLREAAAKFKCDIAVHQTFEFVRYKLLSGKAESFQKTADTVEGVMTVWNEGAGVFGMWIAKSHTKPDPIEKLEGFKVQRL